VVTVHVAGGMGAAGPFEVSGADARLRPAIKAPRDLEIVVAHPGVINEARRPRPARLAACIQRKCALFVAR
jgi:hypothetical protein